jgi:hypothetical protein
MGGASMSLFRGACLPILGTLLGLSTCCPPLPGSGEKGAAATAGAGGAAAASATAASGGGGGSGLTSKGCRGCLQLLCADAEVMCHPDPACGPALMSLESCLDQTDPSQWAAGCFDPFGANAGPTGMALLDCKDMSCLDKCFFHQ